MSNIDKTITFLQKSFNDCEYYKKNPLEKQYRLDHTYRVANIGKEIAENEDIDTEALVIGCLLHDVGYVKDFDTPEEHRSHGRYGAEFSRKFVNGLDIDEKLKKDILYGIAIHVDDKSDFEGERTILVESISDCDNIDRFDTYRLYEALKYSKLDEMTTDEQVDFAAKRLGRLNKLKDFKMKTKTATELWNQKLDYQIGYFSKLLKQLEKTDYKNLGTIIE